MLDKNEKEVIKVLKRSQENVLKSNWLIVINYLFSNKKVINTKYIEERRNNLLKFFGVIYGYLDKQIYNLGNNLEDEKVIYLLQKRNEVNNDMFNILNNMIYNSEINYIIKEIESYPTWKNFDKLEVYNAYPNQFNFINAYNLAYQNCNYDICNLYDKLVKEIYTEFEIDYKSIEDNKFKDKEKYFKL